MSRQRHQITRSAKASGLTFDELYEEISDNWHGKAERLQSRRWHKLKHELTGTD